MEGLGYFVLVLFSNLCLMLHLLAVDHRAIHRD